MSGGKALEMSSLPWVDARAGLSWVEVIFIALASIRGRETREGDTDDDILLRLVSKVLFHPRTVRVRCASIRVWNPWLLAVWITIVITLDGSMLCKAYRDIPFSVVNVLKKSHPMHTMVLLCREPDWLVKDLQGP